jgi:sigma-E factor negative regulatory protein RseA
MERLSEFMDGEAEQARALDQLRQLKDDPESTRAWATYHLIGDTLRGQTAVSRQFSERIAQRLAQEPTVLAPRRSSATRYVRRHAVALAASFAGVALVGWVGLFNNPFVGQPSLDNLALTQGAPTTAVNRPGAAEVVDGDVNEYLLAHQQFSPRTSMQGVASYVRTVSGEDGASR